MRADDALDAISATAAQISGLPVGLVTFLTPERQIFLGRYGMEDMAETPLDQAFCKVTVRNQEPLMVSDARSDDRFRDNPLVTSAPEFRFYAGAPISLDDGRVCGSVCALDVEPHHDMSKTMLTTLVNMARAAGRIISDRIHSDQARRLAWEKQRDAEAASRAKSVFIATMSHELRTPLNAVIGFTEVLGSELYGPLGDPRYKDYMGYVLESSRHLLTLIDDILAISKIDANETDIQLEAIDLIEETQWCLHLLRTKAAARGVKLLDRSGGGPLTVWADRQRCRQVLLNIVGNAVKYTPKGGTVTVSGSDQPTRPAVVVADTGVGMDAETLEAVGEPFLRAASAEKSATPGSGLGLALSKRLIEKMNGELHIESVIDAGTKVTLTWSRTA